LPALLARRIDALDASRQQGGQVKAYR